MSQLKIARESRTKHVAIFSKFLTDAKAKEHCSRLFCFFEGEDRKYYLERITENTTYQHSNIIHYSCGGRDGVLRLHELISKKNELKKIAKAFFIDHDYVPINNIAADMYQTPSYSIENFYTSLEAFKKLLIVEFNISPSDADYESCINDYENRQKEFHEHTLILNAWSKYQRIKDANLTKRLIDLKDIKLNKFFEKISITCIRCRRPLSLSEITEEIPNSHDINQDELNNITERFRNSNKQQRFRGKFELFFLQKIIHDLKQQNKNNTYFSEKRDCINVDPNANTLSSLSKYADTPDCLIQFLAQYHIS